MVFAVVFPYPSGPPPGRRLLAKHRLQSSATLGTRALPEGGPDESTWAHVSMEVEPEGAVPVQCSSRDVQDPGGSDT